MTNITKYKTTASIPDVSTFIDVDTKLPTVDGTYTTVMHCGSMSPYYVVRDIRFKRGMFNRMDWDYVVMWKPLKEKE
jgi:hypothetical protein